MLFVLEPKGLEHKAQLAREHFAHSGPSDAPCLPIGYNEREDTKRQGRLPKIVGLYARSLENRKYDLQQHPSFDDYARGVMASEYNGYTEMKEDEQLKKRFPPCPLKGLGPGLYWAPPDLPARRKRGRPRTAAMRAVIEEVERG
jgi:hypothetical protein